MPDVSVYTLLTKNFVEITLSHTISKINTFLDFMQNFKMATKMMKKEFLAKSATSLCIYPVCQIFFKIALSSTVFQDKCILAFNAEIQDGHQKWLENNIWQNLADASADTL